ncbi:SRPBCC family protein [Nocardia sp. CDC159]|uniref:SRPBCC family protein n=1 Tax=Nocardia pulmonis TaxID=2951408 RepID=A0A9X2E6W4_9NOCA|nr:MULTISPECIES: SRPBCC family protein [Nocardia]MCM6774756.1 SRPBCC family protein [Nocardia pulmonis]MCM6789687.1 SRPBCC family protein [Nocardia sp. CDC159]
MSVVHATFTLEREYNASPATVFAAWSDPAIKARWFAGSSAQHQLDFRVGGRETARGVHDGVDLMFETVYQEIVPDERLVYTSTMHWGETVATISLAAVEFVATEAGTRLVVTEHGVYLDGHEQPAWREEGTGNQLYALARELERTPSSR